MATMPMTMLMAAMSMATSHTVTTYSSDIITATFTNISNDL